jgi:hypothetical protein
MQFICACDELCTYYLFYKDGVQFVKERNMLAARIECAGGEVMIVQRNSIGEYKFSFFRLHFFSSSLTIT